MKKIVLTIAILTAAAFNSFAQQDPLISQYMFNHLLVNPAYAGSKDYAMASALYRNQWVGLAGAPKTFIASIHGPVFSSRKVGLGLTIGDDKIGITNRYSIAGDYAYHIPINSTYKLGIGVRGGIFYQVNDLPSAKIVEENDKVYQGGKTTQIIPEMSAGLYLRSDKMYVGLSVTDLLSYNKNRPLSFDGSQSGIFAYVRHYWLASGYAFEVNPDVVIRPSVMIRYTQNAPLQADLNCNVLLKKILWLGVNFRTGDTKAGMPEAIVGIIEVQATKQLRIGYSYDFTMSPLNKFSNGSHEISVAYDFGYDITKIKSPRYF